MNPSHTIGPSPRRKVAFCRPERRERAVIPNDMPRHNHMTRDIKPEGQCPMCDRYHQRRRANEARGNDRCASCDGAGTVDVDDIGSGWIACPTCGGNGSDRA